MSLKPKEFIGELQRAVTTRFGGVRCAPRDVADRFERKRLDFQGLDPEVRVSRDALGSHVHEVLHGAASLDSTQRGVRYDIFGDNGLPIDRRKGQRHRGAILG